LGERVMAELKHYYSGFKLLFLDVKISSKIIWKTVHGKTLSRRENRQLVRTVSDLFRLVPFSVFIIVPFMELLLPVALKLFPGMLPSTFTSADDREVKLRRALKAKLEYARFLQKTPDALSQPTPKNTRPHRPLFGDLSFWTQPQFLDSSGFSALVFSPSPLLPSDFAGASHFQLVHIHKIKSKWSLVFLLCFRQTIRINF